MASKRSSKKRHSAKDSPTPAEKKWTREIAAWRQGGLSVRAFCEKRRINQSSLRHWVKEIARRERLRGGAKSGPKSKKPMTFLTARLVGAGSSAPYELTLRSGRTLRIRADFEAPVLKRLVAVLETV